MKNCITTTSLIPESVKNILIKLSRPENPAFQSLSNPTKEFD